MASLGLALITNDAEAAKEIHDKYSHYFDKVFITVADKNKKQFDNLISNSFADRDEVDITYFKWCDHFGKARQFNHEQIDTDYFFWMDTDDVIVHPEKLRDLVELMQQENLDALYMRYDYMQNELGEATGDHWRERLVRTKSPFKWANTRVHETLIAPSAATTRTEEVYVLHSKTKEQEQDSLERNIKLLKLEFEETKDPRIAMYLGDNLVAKQEYDEATEYLLFLLQNGGWEEDKYRTWLKLAEIHLLKGDYANALQDCYAAEELKPDWPDAYFLKASIYAEMKRPLNVYECIKTGVLKPKPTTLSVTNPTLYEYKGLFLGAIAAAELGKVNESYKMLQAVLAKSPNYKPAQDLLPIIEEAYYDGEAIEKLKWLLMYLSGNGGDAEKFLMALPQRILQDPRLNFIRSKLITPKVWPKGSVVIYCGMTGETWGADTLEKGMGGSEEAVVYLSRELAKLGHDVTVYNDREEDYVEYADKLTKESEFKWLPAPLKNKANEVSVTYKPWQLLNPNDTFDTFVAWRAPESAVGVKARNVIVDLHDTIQPERVYDALERNPRTRLFVKSNYHRSLYPEAPDSAFVVVGNGIVKEQFV